MMITLRMSERNSQERRSYERIARDVRREISTQYTQFDARARCTATDFYLDPDPQYSTDFIEAWIYDVLCTDQPYNHPRKPSPTLDRFNGGDYEVPLMFYLREKEFLHNFVDAHFRENPDSTYQEAAEAFNRNARRLGLGDPNDFWPQSSEAGRKRFSKEPPSLNATQRQFPLLSNNVHRDLLNVKLTLHNISYIEIARAVCPHPTTHLCNFSVGQISRIK